MEFTQEIQISSEVWYRRSTCESSYPSEFVIDLTIQYPDVITSMSRYTGKTQLEALEDMRNNIVEQLNEVIDNVKQFQTETH